MAPETPCGQSSQWGKQISIPGVDGDLDLLVQKVAFNYPHFGVFHSHINEPATAPRMICLGLIISGIIGLKLVSPEA